MVETNNCLQDTGLEKNNNSKIVLCYILGMTVIPFVLSLLLGFMLGVIYKDPALVTEKLTENSSVLNVYLFIGEYLFISVCTLILFSKNFKKEIKKISSIKFYLAASVLSTIILFILNIASCFIVQLINNNNSISENQQILDSGMASNINIFIKSAYIFFIAVGAPVIEEIIYRYIFQGWINKKLSQKTNSILSGIISVILSSLLFGFVHTFSFSITIIPYFIMGLVLGTTYKLTDNLNIGITAHILNNILSLL